MTNVIWNEVKLYILLPLAVVALMGGQAMLNNTYATSLRDMNVRLMESLDLQTEALKSINNTLNTQGYITVPSSLAP